MVTFCIFTVYSKKLESPHYQGYACGNAVVEGKKKKMLPDLPSFTCLLACDVLSKLLLHLNLNKEFDHLKVFHIYFNKNNKNSMFI